MPIQRLTRNTVSSAFLPRPVLFVSASCLALSASRRRWCPFTAGLTPRYPAMLTGGMPAKTATAGWQVLNLETDVTRSEAVTLEVDATHAVSGMLQVPENAIACYVMAHGAGAGMTHPFMAAVAEGLGERRIATLRYQFPSMEQGMRRPDRPALAHATVRAAIAAAARLTPSLPLVAGGKSFGGRMTSQAQAEALLPGVRGLAFLGFPLHPASKPSDDRAKHLSEVRIPMLFLQGTRDTLAVMQLLAPLVEQLGDAATLAPIQDADHSFHVPVRSGRTCRCFSKHSTPSPPGY